jgi:hypothetical protein
MRQDTGCGSQHWVGKICCFWDYGVGSTDLFCCVRWMCQPEFTLVKAAPHPAEIFATDQFCHDVNVNTLEWDSQTGSVARLRICHLTSPAKFDETGKKRRKRTWFIVNKGFERMRLVLSHSCARSCWRRDVLSRVCRGSF